MGPLLVTVVLFISPSFLCLVDDGDDTTGTLVDSDCLSSTDGDDAGEEEERVASATADLGMYGPGIGGDALGNTTLGGPVGPRKCFIRFRAEQSSPLVTVTFPFLSSDYPGYGGGTGGEWRLDLFADDGSDNHFPTGVPLATQRLQGSTESDAARMISFAPAYSVTEGRLYHLVFENIDLKPTGNYFSLNSWVRLSFTEGGQLNPRFSNADWGSGNYHSGAWHTNPGTSPIADIAYGNGAHQGMCYGEASYACPPNQGPCSTDQLVGRIDGVAKKIRERLTVTGGTRLVSGIGIRLLRTPGTTSRLVVSLRDSMNIELDSVTIPASSVAFGPAPTYSYPASWDDLGRNARWVTASFAEVHALNNGDTYYLQFSSGKGTYWAWVARRLTPEYSYSSAIAFDDGWAEYTTDGSTWQSLGRVAHENDLQFHFVTETENQPEFPYSELQPSTDW